MTIITRWVQRTARLFSSASNDLRQSPLNDLHLKHDGKMVLFAGWSLPVQYAGLGVLNESLHTRSKASIFDVSHMQQLKIHGDSDTRVRFLEQVCVSSIGDLQPNQGQYTLFTNEDGGIIDDAVVTRRDSHHHIVCNAACAEKDILNAFNKTDRDGIELEIVDDQALIAVQGPKSAAVLSGLLDQGTIDDLYFFFTKTISLGGGVPCTVSRSGYTGEDGFEISIPSQKSVRIVAAMLENGECQLAGLGARDALRLEAGLCLYGHDLDEATTPVEANLSWTIGKRRRKAGGFPGADHVLAQLERGVPVTRVRIGLKVEGAPAREGSALLDGSGNKIGRVTSGGFSPTLKYPIAMGYVTTKSAHVIGASIGVQVRKNVQLGTVVPMPFVPSKYVKKPTAANPK